MRRTLLVLTTLFFTILLLEVQLGHEPVTAEHVPSLALLPIVWLSLSLLALIVLQLKPSAPAATVASVAMGGAAVVGILGFFAHLAANGVTLERLDRVFSGAVWGGAACPNWPIAITVAAIIGLPATSGILHEDAPRSRNARDTMLWISCALIVAGIVLSVIPAAAASADCLVLAALLLLALILRSFAATLLARRSS